MRGSPSLSRRERRRQAAEARRSGIDRATHVELLTGMCADCGGLHIVSHLPGGRKVLAHVSPDQARELAVRMLAGIKLQDAS